MARTNVPCPRRRSPGPPPGPPQIQLTPGLGEQTMRELAPLLAEEGIDADNTDVPDVAVLQAALNRAAGRRQHDHFTPAGQARDLAVTALRLVIEALADGDTTLAAAILTEIQPDSPGNTAATAVACIGVALSPLDDWLSGADPQAPHDLAQHVHLPAGHWRGERAATDAYPGPRPQRTGLQLTRHPDRQTRRRTGPLRQRPHPHSGHPDLGHPNRHPTRRHSPRSSALTRLPSTSISHRIATVTGIRGANRFAIWAATVTSVRRLCAC